MRFLRAGRLDLLPVCLRRSAVWLPRGRAAPGPDFRPRGCHTSRGCVTPDRLAIKLRTGSVSL